MPVNEAELVENLRRVVREELERAGLEVYHNVEVEVWQRWDRQHMSVKVRAEVGSL